MLFTQDITQKITHNKYNNIIIKLIQKLMSNFSDNDRLF